LAGHSHTHHYK